MVAFLIFNGICLKTFIYPIGAGNNPMVGMTVACAVAVQEALNK